MIEPGLHLSVGDTHRLIAQARRLRSEYLRASLRQLVASLMGRWSRSGIGPNEAAGPDSRKAPMPQAASPADILREAA
jgi:hypothetical protein